MLINDEDPLGEMSHEDSVISIGQTMARQEYYKMSGNSQIEREAKTANKLKKSPRKIYKESPSISRD